ncbi:PREDICTED: autophagy-related protein 16-1-like [Cyprinodon variegatus]|uniref:autophagy-related protein 16-1-like n=1 Tax=Cyprinodon variegatus TaxID=28743 RepID=UPI0007428704|nr:PREDICTED: autophagy-related protein 16-1-like [Cyprinodon variegatus]XP_015244204.1 PREDICTED: autophagy-related protein 16-1-like [Cyprinodon variegatus]
MESWKNHVRDRLFHRDDKEKLPFVGVFTKLSQLEEKLEIRKQILEDIQGKSLDIAVESGINGKLFQLQLRESEHLADKLSQTVSDMTSVLYVKEAELQYWRSRVSQYHQEALNLAKAKKYLKATLIELEFTVECQSKELTALRWEQTQLKEALEQAQRDNEQLVQRWMEEKSAEAERLNKHNDISEKWQHLSKRLKKHFRQERESQFTPLFTETMDGAKGTSLSVNQRVCNATEDVQIKTASLRQKKSGIALGS